MEHDRAEGHHADQSLFFIGGGLALFVGLGIGLFFGIRRGKKVARREAAKEDQPPESGPSKKRGLRALFGSIGSAFRRTEAKEGSQPPPPPAEPPQSEAVTAQDIKDPKVGT
jgi:hypothetical protein